MQPSYLSCNIHFILKLVCGLIYIRVVPCTTWDFNMKKWNKILVIMWIQMGLSTVKVWVEVLIFRGRRWFWNPRWFVTPSITHTYIYIYTYTYTYIWGIQKSKKKNFSIMSLSVNYISFADVLLLYIDILTKKLLTFYAALSKDMPE